GVVHLTRPESTNLTQRQLAGAALFIFQAGADFEEAIEHLGTLGAAGGKLRVGLFMHVLEAMKFVGDVQGGEDGDFQRVDRQSARRDLAHAAVDKLCELDDVFSVAVRPDVVGLIINLDTDGGTTTRGFHSGHTAFIDHAAKAGAHLSSSAISGSRAATAS